MMKIPTVFVRDEPDRRYVTDRVTPGCEWVLAGEGMATRKYDGTCVALLDMAEPGYHGWYARREVKPGKPRPTWFIEVVTDETTGKTVGWEPVAHSPFVRYFDEALASIREGFGQTAPDDLLPGTYELCGPKINGNPEGLDRHLLFPHATAERIDLAEDLLVGPSSWTPAEVRHMVGWTAERGWEGIVWHHPDGRMAKLKARDLEATE